MLFLPSVDSCLSHVKNDPLCEVIIVRDWVKRRHVLQEDNVGIIVGRAPVPDIINDRPSNRIRKGKRYRLMCFMLNKG